MAAHTSTAAAHEPTPNPYPGETLDSDGHVYIHPDVFREIFPELSFGYNFEFLDDYVKHPEFAERREKNRAERWETKGLGALGAYDPDERVQALDMMGIKAQLMFANNPLCDLRATTTAARDASVRYNDYALDFTRRTKGRCRAVCHVNTSDVDFAIAEANRVIKLGARAVDLPCTQPPGGVSPSHESWDPLWAVLAEADVPAFIHLGNQGLLENDQPDDTMFPHPAWRNSATLMNKPAFRAGGEEAISPYYMLVVHSETESTALAHPAKRFRPVLPVDPNRGMEAVRDIVRAHDELGIVGVALFPVGYVPPVPINDKRMYLIYGRCVELDIAVFCTSGVPGPRLPFEAQYTGLVDEVCWFFPSCASCFATAVSRGPTWR